MRLFSSKSVTGLGTLLVIASPLAAADLRIGIIGTDTSHVVAFTESLNGTNSKTHVDGGKVVAAFKGGSPDVVNSAKRVDDYATKLRDLYGVKFYDSIDELCKNVDAVLLESVDGRPHLEQARPVIKAGKRVFIDKPMAGSLTDAVEIFRLANEANVPVFSSSSLRFAADTQRVRSGSIGKVLSAQTSSPCEVEPHVPELFWYGVHGVESLFTVMGTGCVNVQRGVTTNGMIEVQGTWSGDRHGTYLQSKGYGGIARSEKGTAPVGSFDGYRPLLVEIIKFFQTGIAPVPQEETVEILAFMEASDASKAAGGKPVQLSEILRKAGWKPTK